MDRKPLFPATDENQYPPGGLCWDEDMPGEEEPDGDGGEGSNAPDKVRAGLESAIAAERKKRQELEARLAAIDAEAAERDRKAAEEAGKWKELYERDSADWKAKSERLTALEAREAERVERLTTANAERVSKLPESAQALVPPNMDPEALASWLDKAAPVLAAEERAPAGTRAGGGKKSQPPIPDACIADAKRNRAEPEYWFPIWLKTPAGRRWQKSQTTT